MIRPEDISPIDYLTFIIPPAGCILFIVYAFVQLFHGGYQPLEVVARAGAMTVGLAACVGIIATCIRKNSYDFESLYGVKVRCNGYEVDQVLFGDIVTKTALDWGHAIRCDAELNGYLKSGKGAVTVVTRGLYGAIVSFHEHPIKRGERQYSGWSRPGRIAVGWQSPLDSTALAHELGHLFCYTLTGSKDQEQHHKWALRNGLR